MVHLFMFIFFYKIQDLGTQNKYKPHKSGNEKNEGYVKDVLTIDKNLIAVRTGKKKGGVAKVDISVNKE